MAVKKNLISTQKQAYDYAVASAAAAKSGVCPSTAAAYQNLANKVTAGQFGTDASPASVFEGATAFEKQLFLSALAQVDAMCIKGSDYKKATPLVQSATPGEAVASKEIVPPPQVVKAGFPWWIVVLLGGGALAYYFATKKGSKAPSQKKSKRRRKSRRRRKR